MEDYCRLLLEDFLKTSFSTVKVLVEGVAASKGQNTNRKVTLFRYVDGKKVSFPFSDERFYLRGSVEYTNPQLTIEEVKVSWALGCLKPAPTISISVVYMNPTAAT